MSKNCPICGDSLDTDDETTKTYCIGHTPTEVVREALKSYGATLTEDGFIARDGKRTGVRVVVSRKRLRYQSVDRLLATGPITAESVCKFVADFWFWKKV